MKTHRSSVRPLTITIGPRTMVSLLLVGALAVASAALAAIPDANGVIHACYNKMNGQARLVDSAANCRTDETATSWGQVGPEGPQGPAGPQGPPGPRGPAGSSLNIATLDATGNVGWESSVAIGSDGLGLISYRDFTNGALKVAHCDDAACTSATTHTLDDTLAGGDVSFSTSVAIGSDGLGLISYYDSTHGDLKVAHCDDAACTSATTHTVDAPDNVGIDVSVAIGSDGMGLMSYYDATNDDLKVAHCDDVACTSATTRTLDPHGDVGRHTSVAIGSDGLGLITYFDLTNSDLKVAHCENMACTSATTRSLDGADDVGFHSSVAIGSDGLGLISYYDSTNEDLKVAHCDDVGCTSATRHTLDRLGRVGHYTSAAIGSDGLGLISYWADSPHRDLKVAHCDDAACTAATTHTLDGPGDVGWFPSLAIGSDGLGLISYFDLTNGDLKVAHCGAVIC